MEAFATTLLAIAAASWVGAIVFQSAIVTPTVFFALDSDSARRFLRTLFPRFFELGVGCGIVMIVGVLILAIRASWSLALLTLGAAAVAMLALQLISVWLVPRINAARDAGADAKGRFEHLHRLSVLLTMINLVLGLVTLGVLGSNAATGLTG